MAGIELNLIQTMTREEVMKSREEDAKEIRSAGSKAKTVNHRIVKGYLIS
jgi:hypothetical protein|tara:strand:- start:278 stop:427 length:150 start_codon:yes stop_codon:yes gene_type:complete